MITKTYSINYNFRQWAKNNSDVEHLILEGTLPWNNFSAFIGAFSTIPFKRIDITNLTIEIEGKINEDYCDVLWTKTYNDIFYSDSVSSFRKVLYNKEFANSFHWQDGFLLDDTGTVVIDSETKVISEIPPCVTVIGHLAFAFCTDKCGIKLPDNLQVIGYGAFAETEIAQLHIPDSVKKIGQSAFDGCLLEKLHLPNSLKTIPYACFSYNDFGCVELPQGLKHIEAEAFMGCLFLEQIEIPEEVERIDYHAFDGRTCIKMKFPSTLKTLDKDFYYEDFVDDPKTCVPYIEVHPDNPYFFSKDGTLYSREDSQTPYLGFPYVEP